MEIDLQFDEFLDSDDCDRISDGFQSAIKTAFTIGYLKGKESEQQLSNTPTTATQNPN